MSSDTPAGDYPPYGCTCWCHQSSKFSYYGQIQESIPLRTLIAIKILDSLKITSLDSSTTREDKVTIAYKYADELIAQKC